MLVLGIETSCDETSAAVVDEASIRSNVIWSQQDHARYGGVVPELASRAHVRAIVPVIETALEEAGVAVEDVDGIAVTRGPGLIGSLIVGVNAAKGMALSLGKPFVGVNHLEGHIFSNLVERLIEAPFLTLLVSGGHTELVLVERPGAYELLGQTLDDAAGEAFDKVAKLLDLLPPDRMVMGGRVVAEAAERGDPEAIAFPRALAAKETWDFSFSGLKTAVLNHVRELQRSSPDISGAVPDVAASFQAAVVDVLVERTARAVTELGVPRVALAGGVAANASLRAALQERVAGLGGEFHCPAPVLCTDNAAMIAAAGLFHLRRGERGGFDLDAEARLPLTDARSSR